MIHTVKGFGIVIKENCMFFWNSLAFSMIHQMLTIWSLVPLPFLNPACTSESSQFTYCWSLAWRILSMTLLAYSSALLVAQLVKNCLQCGRPGFDPWVGKIHWRRERLPTPVFRSREFHGLYSPWGRKESNTIEWLSLSLFICVCLCINIWVSLVVQMVKNPPAMWETRVWSLGWEGPLEKVKATHSSVLAGRAPWTV